MLTGGLMETAKDVIDIHQVSPKIFSSIHYNCHFHFHVKSFTVVIKQELVFDLTAFPVKETF